MNEDYLWDKTGHDPEVKKMEDALGAFRYRETSPPALTAKVAAFPPKTPVVRIFRYPSYAAAAAACLVFLAMGLGLWMQFSAPGEENEIAVNNSHSYPNEKPAGKIVVPAEPGDTVSITQPVKQIVAAKRELTQGRYKNIREQKSVRPAIRLTKEEVFAYSQLKLALAITGSKLKLLKDKVESPAKENEENAVRKIGR